MISNVPWPSQRVLLCLVFALALPMAQADVIRWAETDERGQLAKPFDDRSAGFVIDTASNSVTFTLDHRNTTGGMVSASQWTVNRWPEPAYEPETGDFNVVTNGNNDVVLSMYGYYGENGADDISTVPRVGDSTTYQLSLDFAQSVSQLEFEVNGINALTKSTGFNSRDTLVVEGFLGNSAVPEPDFLAEGTGFVRDGNVLDGDWLNRIGLDNEPPYDLADQHITSEGSLRLRFDGPVDRVFLTLSNTAENPIDTFAPGFDDPNTPDTEERWQTWAFSVGDLSFHTIPEPSTAAFFLSAVLALATRRSRRQV